MLADRDIAERIVDTLNEAHKADPKAIEILVRVRSWCNQPLAEHPSIQCGTTVDGLYTLGLVGLLNGFVGEGPIRVAAQFSVDCPTHGSNGKGSAGKLCPIPGCTHTLHVGALEGFQVVELDDLPALIPMKDHPDHCRCRHCE